MATPSRLMFVNLPVKDLPASTAFFRVLGFDFDERFADDGCACMTVSEHSHVMLLTESRFAEFTTKPIADAHGSAEALLCVSAGSRDAVDLVANRALDFGGSPAGEATDYGFMYGRSFHDLDGHHWSVIWLSPEAVEQGEAVSRLAEPDACHRHSRS